MWLISLFWQLVTDPQRFAIDHWPSIVVLVFLVTLYWMWPTYMMLARSRVVQVLVIIGCCIMVTWSVRGRWDDDQFEKERAGFRDTITQIEEAQQAAIIAAQDKVRAQEAKNRENVTEALAIATKEREKMKGDMGALQRRINAMSDTDVKGCAPDPILRDILKSRGK